jgi:hypothetical protein
MGDDFEEGTLMFVLSWPRPWPPSELVVIRNELLDTLGTTLSILGWPGGQLGFRIADPTGKELLNVVTQPISPDGVGMAPVLVAWTAEVVEVWARGEPVQLKPDGAPFRLKLGPDHLMARTRSFDSPAAEEACASAILGRKKWYGQTLSKVDADQTSRVRTIDEDAEDVARYVESIIEYIRRLRAGDTQPLPALAVALRVLLVDQKYAPLLRRHAARIEAPLPVFAALERPRFSSPAVTDFNPLAASTLPLGSGWALVDVEKALGASVYRWTSGSTVVHYSARELLSAVAGTGGAHSAISVPHAIDALERSGGSCSSKLVDFLLSWGALAAELGDYLLRRGGWRPRSRSNDWRVTVLVRLAQMPERSTEVVASLARSPDGLTVDSLDDDDGAISALLMHGLGIVGDGHLRLLPQAVDFARTGL